MLSIKSLTLSQGLPVEFDLSGEDEDMCCFLIGGDSDKVVIEVEVDLKNGSFPSPASLKFITDQI